MPPLRKGIAAIKISATVPDAPAAPTVVLGTGANTTDTFTWVAPASNGAAITKYGYQISTNNGSSYGAEVETAGTTLAINTAYVSTSSKIRVRAFNSVGFGPYSTISTNGTGAWTLGAVSQSQSCSQSCSQGCSCGGCDCGTNNGTQTGTQTGTQSRTCYTWTRSGSTTSIAYNSNGSTPCNAAYGGCGSFGACGSFGGCTSCSGCGSWDYVSQDWGTTTIYDVNGNNGVYMYWYSSAGSYDANNYGSVGCGGYCAALFSVQRCSATGALRYVSGPNCLEC